MNDYFETLDQLSKELLDMSQSEFNQWLINYAPTLAPEEQIYVRCSSAEIRGCGVSTWVHGVELDGTWHFEYDSNSRSNKAICKIIMDGLEKQTTAFIANVKLYDYMPVLKLVTVSQMQIAQRILNQAQKIALTK
jgi:sulfur transfer protein SufE